MQLVGSAFEGLAVQSLDTLKLVSPAFKDNGFIPMLYTAEGKDVSPPLVWGNIPSGTRTLALICEDPDVPAGPWVHWVLYNIPTTLDHIEEGGKNLKPDVRLGKNSGGSLAYGGPNLPSGTHHYRFTLYALDTTLDLKEGPTKEQLTQAMQDHILAEAPLIGLYQRQDVKQ